MWLPLLKNLKTYAMGTFLRSLVAILLMGAASVADAQIYVTDDNFADSVSVHRIVLSADGKYEQLGDEAFSLPMGMTVKVERLLKGQTAYGLINIDGKKYGISSGELLFSDENPEGTEDIFGNTRDRVNHSVMGKFFATMTPYWIIAFLFILAMAFMWAGLKNEKVRRPALIVVPGCILVGSLLEVWAYCVLGSTAFWWCDPDRYGFFGALFRVLPFMAIVAFQLYSIKLYMRLLTNDEENGLSVKPMLLSIGLCIPIAIAVTFLCAGVFGLKSTALAVVTVVTFLLSLGIGLYISTKKNLKELGKTAGTMFTLFGIAWAVGAVVAIVGLVIVIFKLIFQILVIVAAVVSVGSVMGKEGSGSSSAPKRIFYDRDGNAHYYTADRDNANKKIAERKGEI